MLVFLPVIYDLRDATTDPFRSSDEQVYIEVWMSIVMTRHNPSRPINRLHWLCIIAQVSSRLHELIL